MGKLDNKKTAWKGKSNEIKKPWGSVISWSALKTVGGKIIKIEKNHRTSLKYNTLKDEALFIISGKVIVSTWDSVRKIDNTPEMRYPLTQGDTFNIQSEVPFRITAIEDSYIVEISNGKNNQIVRLKDDYGRIDEKP